MIKPKERFSGLITSCSDDLITWFFHDLNQNSKSKPIHQNFKFLFIETND